MTLKHVQITFIGGHANGETIEEIPVNQLRSEVSIRLHDDIYFATNPSGGMSIMKGNLNQFWHSYSVSVYQKSESTQVSTGNVNYDFVGYRDVERCNALTQKNVQCMKAAIHGKTFCTTHNHVNKTKEINYV